MATRMPFSLQWSIRAAVVAVAISVSLPLSAGTTHLYIVGTNDIHGALAPHVNATTTEGGLALLAGYVDALRRAHPGRVIWLDAGDEFQGSIESNSEEGEPVVEALNASGVTAAAIGNHEFDFGPAGPDDSKGDVLGALRARIAEARYPFLSANIVDKSTGVSPFGNGTSSILRSFGGVRVGIIGLTTTSTATSTWPEYVRNLAFLDLRDATLREAAKLRQDGAEVLVVVAHAGLRCADDHRTQCSGEIVDLLQAIPQGTVDAVVSGHSHTIVETTIAGVPVVQAGSKSAFLNIIELPFDTATRRVVRDAIRIEGPVPVRMPAKIDGVRVRSNRRVGRILRPVFRRVAPLKNRVVATSDSRLDRKEDDESAIGDLVADAIRTSTGADVAIVNAGGVRASLPAGNITYGDVFEVLPFENKLILMRVTGRELKTILRVAESGAIGYFPVAGVHVTINSCTKCPADDLDANGHVETWETNRLLDVTRDDATPIRDDAEYTLATIDFLLLGGDHMGWPLGQIPADRIAYEGLLVRDALVNLLAKRKHLTGGSEAVRMTFVKREVAESTGGAH